MRTLHPFNTNPAANKRILIKSEDEELVIGFIGLPRLQERLLQIEISTDAVVSFTEEAEWIGTVPVWTLGLNVVMRVLRVESEKVLVSYLWGT